MIDDGDAHLGRTHLAAAHYPPEPWHLHGQLLLSVLRVPERVVPGLADVMPPGHRPLRLGGDVLLGLALVHYAPGGVLIYDELLTAVLTLPAGRPRPRVTIPQIWVTSAESAAGGRELWAIPKERCTVVRHATASAVHGEVTADGAPLATLTARLGRRLVPGRLPLTLTTAQRRPVPGTGVTAGGASAVGSGRGAVAGDVAPGSPSARTAGEEPVGPSPAQVASAALGGFDGALPAAVVVSGNRLTTEVRTMRARWDIAPGGPLGHLAGRRPLLSLALTGATIVFGHHVERRP